MVLRWYQPNSDPPRSGCWVTRETTPTGEPLATLVETGPHPCLARTMAHVQLSGPGLGVRYYPSVGEAVQVAELLARVEAAPTVAA
jgi:hypothetical protein